MGRSKVFPSLTAVTLLSSVGDVLSLSSVSFGGFITVFVFSSVIFIGETIASRYSV